MDLNTALHWWPRVKELRDEFPQGVDVPETVMVRFDFQDALDLLLGREPRHFPFQRVLEVIMDLGVPIFVRTDQASAKHRGPQGCRVEEVSREAVKRVVTNVLMVNMEKWVAPRALMVREWLDLEVSDAFKAFGGTVIGREFRFFVYGGEVMCRHYYWPEESLDFGLSPVPDWRERRQRMANDPVPEVLGEVAVRVAEVCSVSGGKRYAVPWCVDFVEDVEGQWFLTDIAVAIQAGHPGDCEKQQVLERIMLENAT